MGWLSRQAGLSIDNLVSAEVVVADGRILRAAEDKNPDLFWAIRGGGGNFGVVTELEFRLHDVDPVVQFGLLFWDAARGQEALQLMREVVAELPRSLNAIPAAITAPPAPFVPPEHHTSWATRRPSADRACRLADRANDHRTRPLPRGGQHSDAATRRSVHDAGRDQGEETALTKLAALGYLLRGARRLRR
jgi:hypothetical protein